MLSQSALLGLPGAIEAVRERAAEPTAHPDAAESEVHAPALIHQGVAEHYGSPLAEQRALFEGTAIVDLSHRGIVTVAGEDRLSWLNSFTSQDVAHLTPGESTETLLLDANGRIEQAIRITDDGERAWLLVDEDFAEPLLAFLLRMRFALRVEPVDASADFTTVLAFDRGGSPALSALRALGTAVVEWRDPWADISRGGVQYAHGEHPGEDWTAVQVVFPRSELPQITALVSSGAARAAGLSALSALEVRAWRPSQHADVDERAIPHEFDWLRSAVHMTKGCYRGQETVAKVHNLGHPPRRLTMLHLDGSGGELPIAGALVYLAGESQQEGARPVGRITRAALHYEWGGIALALLKRSVKEDAALEVRAGAEGATAGSLAGEPVACAQEVIVPSDAGATRRADIAARLGRNSPRSRS